MSELKCFQQTVKYYIVKFVMLKLEVQKGLMLHNTCLQKNTKNQLSKVKKKLNIEKAQRLLTNTKKSCFDKDLCSAMLSANIIPLNKIE